MGVFQFRLQSLYELRQHLEKEKKDRFAEETAKLNRLLEENESMEKQYARWSQTYIAAARKGISPAMAVQMSRYLEDVARHMRKIALEIELQAGAVEAARQDLLEKMKERKIIGALRDKRYQSFCEEEKKAQEKEIEEMILNRLPLA